MILKLNVRVIKKKIRWIFALILVSSIVTLLVFSQNMNDIFPSNDAQILCQLTNSTKQSFSQSDLQIQIEIVVPIVCQKSDKFINIVSFVHSSRDHFRHRKFIRKTSGQIKRFKNYQFGTVFVVGSPNPSENKFVKVELEKEIKDYSDIIVGSFVDSYFNMTFKHLVGYKWVLDNCKSADYVLKMDDDWMPNIFKLFDLIQQMEENQYAFSCIGADKNDLARIQRKNSQKWCMHKLDYAFDYFPEYCYGLGILQPRSTVEKLYPLKDSSNFLWIDDVYISGVLRAAYEILHYQHLPILFLPHNQYEKLAIILEQNESLSINDKSKVYSNYYYLEIDEYNEGDGLKVWNILCSNFPNEIEKYSS